MYTQFNLTRFTSTIESWNGLLDIEIPETSGLTVGEATTIAAFIMGTLARFTYLSGSAHLNDGEGLDIVLDSTFGGARCSSVNAWGSPYRVLVHFEEETGTEILRLY